MTIQALNTLCSPKAVKFTKKTNLNYSVHFYCVDSRATVFTKIAIFWFLFYWEKSKNLIITQMDCEPTACVAHLPHSSSLRPGWDTDCNQTGGWELGRRHAGRQDRHLSYPLRGGKCTDMTLNKMEALQQVTDQSDFTNHAEYLVAEKNIWFSSVRQGCCCSDFFFPRVFWSQSRLNSRSCWSTVNGRVVLPVGFLSLRLH